MQPRKSFTGLLLPALGYMVMGNLMATVMSFSLYSFAANQMIMGIAVLFAIAIYLLLVAVPAYKDGQYEHVKLRNPANKIEDVPKYRWLQVGAILFAIMLIPCLLLLIGAINTGWFRLVCGAVNPLAGFLANGAIPFAGIAIYALTIPACHIGFKLGLTDKISGDKFMYK